MPRRVSPVNSDHKSPLLTKGLGIFTKQRTGIMKEPKSNTKSYYKSSNGKKESIKSFLNLYQDLDLERQQLVMKALKPHFKSKDGKIRVTTYAEFERMS